MALSLMAPTPKAETNDRGRIYAEPRPLMRGGYLVRSARAVSVLRIIDLCLSMFRRRRSAPAVPTVPKRILVANWAHLGDVLTSLPALRVLREAFPAAEIDLIVGRAGRAAVEGTDLCDRVFEIDHFVLNRSRRGRWCKFRRYLQDRRAFLAAAKQRHYDAAIDLYAYFPPAAPLFRQAGITVRCGFTSGGFGPLLSHPVTWSYDNRPIGQYGRDLIGMLWPSVVRGMPTLPAYRAPRRGVGRTNAPYVVIHAGVGASWREWPIENWTRLIDLWHDAPQLVFCAVGQQESERARQIAAHCPESRRALFLDNSWRDFVSLLEGAAGLVCLESSASHVAAGFGVPTVVIYSGANEPRLWGPDNPNAMVLSAPTGCAPCHRAGCDAMACIRDITPQQVLAAIRSVIKVPVHAAD